MLKKMLIISIITFILASCSIWGLSDDDGKPAPDDPTVGSKASSDMLFGQSAIEPTEQKPLYPQSKNNASTAK